MQQFDFIQPVWKFIDVKSIKSSKNILTKKIGFTTSLIIWMLVLMCNQNAYAQPAGYAFRMQANNNFGTAYVLNNNSPTTGILSTTVQAASTANNYLVEWDGFANKWSNTNHVKNTEVTLTWGGGSFNGPDGTLSGSFLNTKFYTLQIRGLSYSSRQGIIMETDNTPQSFHATNSTAVSTPTAVCAGANAIINITLAGNKSAQERVFVRYAVNNNFAASKVVEATGSGSTWSTASATIPGSDHTAGTTINYYAYTTTVAATNTSDHDLITLRFGNNGGSNYSYFVNANPTVNAGSPLSAICQGGTTVSLGGSFGGGATSAVWSDGGAGGSFANNSGSTPGTATYTAANNSTSPVTLTLTTSGGSCGTTSANKQLVVNANPTVNAGSPLSAICQGGTTVSLGGSFGGGATSAVWSDGGAGGSFANNSGSTPGTATYTAANNSTSPVTLTLTTSGGSCGTTSANKQLVVNANNAIMSVTAGTNPVCTGFTTNLTANGVAGTNTSVTWWTGAGGTGTNLGTGNNLNNVGAGTYYARVTGNCGAAAEASITISTSVNTFSGTGNWTDVARWSCGAVPVSGDAIVIGAGAIVTLNTNFTVTGNLTMTATSAMFVNVANTFDIAVGGTANFNGQSVTFRSSNTGTASLGKILGTLSGATNVTVERFIPNNGFRSWRLLSVPTFGNGQTIRQAWQEGVANPNPMENNLPGFGTQITTGGLLATVQAAGFDNTSGVTAGAGYASIMTYNSVTNAWDGITNTNIAIANNKAYFLYVRGERSKGVNEALASDASATTLRSNGTIYQGNQSSGSLAANKFHLIGNLYPSAIEFTSLTRSGGVNNLFYIWDSKKLSGSSLGVYQTFSATNGFNCLIAGGSFVQGQPNLAIQSGQAFFVSTGASTGSITLNENSKVSNNGTLGFRPTTPLNELVKIDSRLYRLSGNETTVVDANAVVFDNIYSNDVADEDARKLSNNSENFAVQKSGTAIAIEGRKRINVTDTIQFKMWNMLQQSYQFEFVPQNLGNPSLTAFLHDDYLNSNTTLDLNTTNTINFVVDANAASTASNRFKIVFIQSTPLPVSFISVSANRSGNNIKVDWKVAAERGIRNYEVERSTDGRNFVTAGIVSATGNSTAELGYTFTDLNVAAISLYYRIKSNSVAGDVKYTNIVKLSAGIIKPGFSVSPNPVEGTVVNLQFKNQPAGKYNVRLISMTGQAVFATITNHAGGNSTQLLQLPEGLARGTYQIELIAPDMKRTLQSIIILN